MGMVSKSVKFNETQAATQIRDMPLAGTLMKIDSKDDNIKLAKSVCQLSKKNVKV